MTPRSRTLSLTLTLMLLGGCGPKPPPASRPAAAPAMGTWKTMRAEHRVSVDVTLDDGSHDRRALRGAIAVARPDRFRLRALGPGGLTLFDILDRGGDVKVIQAIRDPKASALGGVIVQLAGDLAAAFGLAPVPAARHELARGGVLTVEEPDRTVRLSQFHEIAGQPVAGRIEVENRARRYAVSVEVRDVEIDPELDPALFADP